MKKTEKKKEAQESLRFMPDSWQGGGWDHVHGMPVFRFLHAGTPPFAEEAERTLTGENPHPKWYMDKLQEMATMVHMNPQDFAIASAIEGAFLMLEGDYGPEQQAQDVLLRKMIPDAPEDFRDKLKEALKKMPRKHQVRFIATLNVETTNFREYIRAYLDWFAGVCLFIEEMSERRC